MSSSFAALMALSASNTQQQQASVQSALADRQRREAAQRKAQEEKDRKERELEAKIRLRRLEEDKREQERRDRLERERQAKERERERREKEELARLLGEKKRKQLDYPSSSSGGGPGSAGGALSSGRRRDDEDGPAVALTREEKRERKLQAELRREFNASKGGARSAGGSGGYGRAGRRLPGGATDVIAPDGGSAGDSAQGSIRARLQAMPNMLTKLNVNKRDTRTIDEIIRDRDRAKESKILGGEEAKSFSDWFSTEKKKEPAKKATPPKSGTSSPAPVASSSSACRTISSWCARIF
jgi:protein SPT2